MNKSRLMCHLSLYLVSLGFLAPLAKASAIIQNTSDEGLQIQYFQPGQSFTAEDPDVSFGFYISAINSFLSVTPITMTVYDGSGLSGTALLTTTFSPVANFSNYFDIDLSAYSFTIGNVYTVGLTSSNAYWGTNAISNGDPYAGGTAFLQGNAGGCCGVSASDMRFRVLPIVSDIPEPGTISMFSLGLAGCLFGRRVFNRNSFA